MLDQGTQPEGEGSVGLAPFIKVASFVKTVNNVFNVKESSTTLVSTRRSSVLSLPVQQGFPA
jgi:hypothetical protein